MDKALTSIIRIGVIAVILIAIAHLQNWGTRASVLPANPVCTSVGCKILGEAYQKNMDKRGSPCTDFYGYVCSGFPKWNPRPEDTNLWNVHSVIHWRIKRDLKRLVEDPKTSTDPEMRQTKLLYNTCMKIPYLQRSKPNVLKEIMSKINYWPMFPSQNKSASASARWWKIDKEYLSITGKSALFGFTIAPYPSAKNHILTELRQISSAYGSIKLIPMRWNSIPKQKQHYIAFLQKVIKSVAPQNPAPFTDIIEKDLEDIINFRESLKQIPAGKKTKFDRVTLNEFQNWYGTQAKAVEGTGIDWLELIRAIYKDGKYADGVPITDKSMIAVQSEYFADLAKLLKVTPERVIINHIHLYFAEIHILRTKELTNELDQTVHRELFSNNMILKHLERWVWCIEKSNVKSYLGHVYIKSYLQPFVKNEIEQIFNETKFLQIKQIEQSTWLDPNLKQVLIRKVQLIRTQLGFPKQLVSDGSFTRDMDPLNVNAFFQTKIDQMSVGPGLLHWPIYTPSVSYAIKYGATAAMIGHELYHAFSDTGRKFYSNGDITWSKNMDVKFKEHMECFADQYNHYKDNEFQKFKMELMTSLVSSVDEDTADVMGLKLAYSGFKKQLLKSKGTCPVLPGFEKITCDKLFFIAFANTFCSGSTAIQDKITLIEDPHNPAHIRVNGAVANLKEFSAAFGCKPKDRLNLEKRCDLWGTSA